MVDEGGLFDAFLNANRRGDTHEVERLLAQAPTGALQRLMALRQKARAKRAEVQPDQAPEPGLPFERLGEFRLLRRIGAGGMGELFLAQQDSVGRSVALKVIRRELLSSPTARERFRREALAAGRLQHPGLVTVYASGEENDVAYIAMEFVRGSGMDELLRDGARIGTRQAVRWATKLARALSYAHDRGVLHRDVKPSNIRITPANEPVLLDFGIARDERWSGRTVTQAFAGSLSYAAPEQLAGREVDGRVDVYALGVTLYEALTQRLPIPGNDLAALLQNEPTPARAYNATISPDLETVLQKALAKSPEARYASAAAFADDLDAILDLRPIQARPPTRWERVRRKAREHPQKVVAAITVLVALAVFAGYRFREKRQEARELVTEARQRLEVYGEHQSQLASLEERFVELEAEMHARYLTEEEDRAFEESVERVANVRQEREVIYHQVIELLRRARELDPDVPGASALRTDLYMQRWRDARAERDEDTERFYGRLVRAHDDAGRHREELDGDTRIAVTTEPPDAEVHLFRLVEQAELFDGGERRFVPVPWRGDTPVAPGTICLRVIGGWEPGELILEVAGEPVRDSLFVLEDIGALRKGDRVVSVNGERTRARHELPAIADRLANATIRRGGSERTLPFPHDTRTGDARALAESGGVSVKVWRAGRVQSAVTPDDLEVRATAAPKFFSSASRIEGQRLTRGRWVIVARRNGYSPQSFALDSRMSSRWAMRFTLTPKSDRVAGFVRVTHNDPRMPPYRIMEHEVTAAQYLAFLNHPETQESIRRSTKIIRVPRAPSGDDAQGYWSRREDGTYDPGDDWPLDAPVLGVNWHDAQAYVAWRNRRREEAGLPGRFALPTYMQWLCAAHASSLADYPWGNQFRPKWASSCYSRPVPGIERVMSYPIDESVHGVFDLSGSAREWLRDWVDDAKTLRRTGGGSWGHANPKEMQIYGAAFDPSVVSGVFGFRLVLEDDR